MIKRASHITSLFAVLISVSLSMATLHFHHAAEHHGVHADPGVPHQIDSDASLCPVCGYLFSSETVDTPNFSTNLDPVEPVIIPDHLRYLTLLSDAPDARSPPSEA